MDFLKTQQEKVNYLKSTYNASEVVLVDSFDSLNVYNHVCRATSPHLVKLASGVYQVPTPVGMQGIELFYCSSCRKLILNKMSLV